ncbi:acetyl/propionyl-CoA carboxylase subuit alpha [Prauserella marina]|uniref:Propionyl-CoA carboxylase alpha chain n=1 Tax=Prauserella marina TaxID=530584 RepID=A0A222VSF1_9PSEU|nr:biotin carboxylase N-terminal domain-containing protein [Prauserella marina]ASR36820.1 acetyl/propionyl-CoA carboxylase subuit alpha [Prauserella marina]PWV80268.1 propionyl-CoA carboxylase alpha chain [Prauserella marina]SDD50637.1 propionyl-CoA carboxylase alpha chain [Prauserella marina]
MIENVLVANRGEIALRVFRSCRDAGIGTVAVYSDADAASPHVSAADAAVRLPGETPGETYLRADLIVDAARQAGADAVHPGYGFLSENADFARAVGAAGLTWIGPSPEAIETMGSKVESKRLLGEAGVPVLPELDPGQVTESDLPVLVKASSGGGGRGMRVVRELADLPSAVDSASAEAASAFGDPTVFCERYVDHGRHIEVQIMADIHGTVWALGERECSIQRRHQKVIEEAPSPLVGTTMRENLFAAARTAAKAIDYVGAGTVEFLATETGEFFFLEMNTRLQVEHPVTECTTGLDLVDLQLRVAEGEALQGEPPPREGHAIEARLYAEDPAGEWRPQTGTLHRFRIPCDIEFAVPVSRTGIRVDSGVADGFVIGTHYDPMLAKVISWAPSRTAAARALAGALARAQLHGVTTNRDLLVNVVRHPAFLAGDTDTGFFERHGVLATPLADAHAERLCGLAAALAEAAANRREARVLGGLPSGWRNLAAAPQHKTYVTARGTEHDVRYRFTRAGLTVEELTGIELVSAEPGLVVLADGGVRRTFTVGRYPGLVVVDSPLGTVTLTPVPRFTEPGTELAPGSLVAPMPGTVVRLAVTKGDTVKAGAPLLWLEAMKMEHRVAAPADGVVTELPVEAGRQVEQGAVLAVVRARGEFPDEQEAQ